MSFCFAYWQTVDYRDTIRYAVKNSDIVITTCRESIRIHCYDFQENHQDSNFFAVKSASEKVMNAKIQKIKQHEDKIKVPIRQRAKFHSTNIKNCFIIKPNWWGENLLRFEILTILLKKGKTNYLSANQSMKNLYKLFTQGYTRIDDYNDYDESQRISNQSVDDEGGLVNWTESIPQNYGLTK